MGEVLPEKKYVCVSLTLIKCRHFLEVTGGESHSIKMDGNSSSPKIGRQPVDKRI
jgi:hypothetical protein